VCALVVLDVVRLEAEGVEVLAEEVPVLPNAESNFQ
jgi:hypothetical protein